MVVSASSIIVIVTAIASAGVLLFYRPLAASSTWRAAITPLASIMGSGFLVCAPLLYAGIGNYAVLAMAGAYCISVSYYLQLLASFALQPFSFDGVWLGKTLVTGILAGIGFVGVTRGLKGIERVERVVVGINLSMIAALIAGLIFFNISALSHGTWSLHPMAIPKDKIHIVRLLMGMLIVVQGFETSRFLGAEHPKEERIRTMKLAQLVSSAIYILFIFLMAVVINQSDNAQTGITAIVSFSKIIAPILPVLITVTAIGSQFSAATADDAGCSGLLEAILKKRIPAKDNYVIVSLLAITLTWLTNVYQIISFASRAFALYYAIQCVVAILVMQKVRPIRSSAIKTGVFGALGAVCVLVTLFGIPAG